MLGVTKDDCIKAVRGTGIKIPRAYEWGLQNNNCARTGCVQGGIGYWQKMRDEFPEKLEYMATIEHELTDEKGQPVSMLKDQSNEAKEAAKKWKFANLVFLKKHPDYPQIKELADMKGREVKPLKECNGFCGVNDLNEKNETEEELNLDLDFEDASELL